MNIKRLIDKIKIYFEDEQHCTNTQIAVAGVILIIGLLNLVFKWVN